MAVERSTLTLRRERVLLIGLQPSGGGEGGSPLAELEALLLTAGGVPVGQVLQRREAPDPVSYLGRGKLGEIRALAAAESADALVTDDELSAAQIRNLEKATGIRVFDRSELILDIFAVGARTREAKLQVALAQMEYGLPRLRRSWTHLDRVGGGIGMRGGIGETQLEVDQRLARKRIGDLQWELRGIQARRHTEVASRRDRFSVALVGYTNAGKSALMRRLTGYAARSEDRLFSTLDTRTRRAKLDGAQVLVSDTVGFIRKLPHHLVASFRATLEEVREADLLLHVIDAPAPDARARIEAVTSVLDEMGGIRSPVWQVWNKVDRLDGMSRALLPAEGGEVHRVSALSGEGMEALARAIGAEATRRFRSLELVLDAADGEALARLAAEGRVLGSVYENGSARVTVALSPAAEQRLRKWEPDRIRFPDEKA